MERAGMPRHLALVTILKGMMGAGLLSLPFVFSKVRLALALPGYLVVTVICAFSVWRLIQCKALLAAVKDEERKLCGSDDELSSCSSARSSAAGDFGLGPLALVARRSLGFPGLALAAFGILVSQFGFCVAYVQVIVETLRRRSLLGSSIPEPLLRLLLLLVLCCLCLLRQLQQIARLSGAALAIYCYLLWALVWWGGQELAGGEGLSANEAWLPVGWSSGGLWFGTAIFAQEAIVISQYVYDDMQLNEPREFLPVLIGSFGICGALSTFVGSFGYLCYGDDIKDVFYLNFPANSLDVNIVEVILCLVLIATFVLQLYPVVTFAEALASRCRHSAHNDSSSSDSESLSAAGSVALRWLLVLAASVAAASIPNLSCITGYSGSFAMSAIGFFLPPLCHMQALGFRLSLLDWAGDLLLLVAGVAAVVFGVLSSSC